MRGQRWRLWSGQSPLAIWCGSGVVVISRSSDCILTTLPGGGGVLLLLKSKRYLSLNATGVFVWQALEQGPRSHDDLVAAVVARFVVQVDQASRDVIGFADALLAEGAVDVGEQGRSS